MINEQHMKRKDMKIYFKVCIGICFFLVIVRIIKLREKKYAVVERKKSDVW